MPALLSRPHRGQREGCPCLSSSEGVPSDLSVSSMMTHHIKHVSSISYHFQGKVVLADCVKFPTFFTLQSSQGTHWADIKMKFNNPHTYCNFAFKILALWQIGSIPPFPSSIYNMTVSRQVNLYWKTLQQFFCPRLQHNFVSTALR